jgi:hypothetical protein
MRPVKFDKVNAVLNPPPDVEDVAPLFVQKRTDGIVTSCWELTPEELMQLVDTGKIYLHVSGPHPAVMLSVAPLEGE